MDQKMQLKIQLAEKEAQILRQEAQILRLKLEHMEIVENGAEDQTHDLPTTIKKLNLAVDDHSLNKISKSTLKSALIHLSMVTCSPCVPKTQVPVIRRRAETIKICQKLLILNGFHAGDCAQCLVKNLEGKITFQQCPQNALATGLCAAHTKAHGGAPHPHNPNSTNCHTRMLLLTAKKCLINAESFGSAEYLDTQPKSHQTWTRKVIANLD